MLSLIKKEYFNYLVLSVSLLIIFSTGRAGGQENAYVAAIDSDGVQRIEILAGEYFFDPKHIIVKANIPVEIKIKKEPGLVPHRFVLKDAGAGIDIYEDIGAEPKIIKLTPRKAGKYLFYCDRKLLFFKGHREQTFINSTAHFSIKKKKGMSDGSIIAKENYTADKKFVALSVMYKIKGYNPAGGDWFWAQYNPDGKAVAAGKVKKCIDCHSKKKDNDYIFTGDVKK